MGIILNKDKLIDCASELINASSLVVDAKTKIYSANKMSSYSCNTKNIDSAFDNVNSANRNLANLITQEQLTAEEMIRIAQGTDISFKDIERTFGLTAGIGDTLVTSSDNGSASEIPTFESAMATLTFLYAYYENARVTFNEELDVVNKRSNFHIDHYWRWNVL